MQSEQQVFKIAAKRIRDLALAVSLVGLSAASAQLATPELSDPVGEWLVQKKNARIKIVDCYDFLWGFVSWQPHPTIDSKNPHPELRARSIVGTSILLSMKQNGSDQWHGSIYNPEDGGTYSANIRMVDSNTLRVQGCLLGFLCRKEDWTRVATTDVEIPPSQAATAKTRSDICRHLGDPAQSSR